MRNAIPSAVAVLTLLAAASRSFGEAPATPPDALKPDGLTQVVRIWPGEPPATSPVDEGDAIQRRGTTTQPSYVVSNVRQASLAVFPSRRAGGPASAVIVCPGGGYQGEWATGEGFVVAERLAEQGVAAFVLKYRLPTGQPPTDGQLPVPQQDALRAVQFVRHEAERFGVDPKRVGVMGFSAGGHLAATAATLFDQAGSFAEKAGGDAVSQTSARPDFAVLMYPVITMEAAKTHKGSRNRLLGDAPSDDVVARFSAERHVTPQTPALFIAHAEDDKTVPIANTQLMADAASAAGVPCDLVIFHKGGHGFGLGRPNTDSMGTFDRLLAWMRTRKLVE